MHVYINTPPCPDCVMHINQAGIKCIVCGGGYPEEVRKAGREMAEALDIFYVHLKELLSEKEYQKIIECIL